MVDKDQVHARIAVAKRQEEDAKPRWNQTIDMLLGDWGNNGDNPKLAPNSIWSTYRSMLASLDLSDPEIYAQAQDAEGLPFEDPVVATLIYHWKDLKVNRQSRLSLADALLKPFGVLQLGMGRAYMAEKALAAEEEQKEIAFEENQS